MASEDVLEQADEWLRGRVHFSNHATSSPARRREIRLVYDLAAEVRELRKDKTMLDFILRCGPILLVDTDESGRLRKSWDDIETREDVIAAMRDSCQLPKEDE